MSATAAVLVIGISASAALFVDRAQTASAAGVLTQVEDESFSVVLSAQVCRAAQPISKGGGGVVAFSGGAGQTGGPGPVTEADASQLSDKLAQALGVSGDQLRAAMRAALNANLPTTPPPDPVARIAQELGVSTEQVCAAFYSPQGTDKPRTVSVSGYEHQSQGIALNINGTGIDLNTVTADQLNAPAQKLGVTPERLLQAIKVAVPAPSELPAKPSPDELIDRLAQNLGMSSDRVKAAITQVEGPNRFFFAVPDLPRLAQGSR